MKFFEPSDGLFKEMETINKAMKEIISLRNHASNLDKALDLACTAYYYKGNNLRCPFIDDKTNCLWRNDDCTEETAVKCWKEHFIKEARETDHERA